MPTQKKYSYRFGLYEYFLFLVLEVVLIITDK